MTIIQTSAGQHYRVWETNDASLAHVWYGVAVKFVKGQWVDKAKARTELVRKVATRLATQG